MQKKLMIFLLVCAMGLTACGNAQQEAAPTTKPTGAAVSESTEAAATSPTNTPAEETTNTPAEETTNTPAEETTNTPAEETTNTPAEETTNTPTEEITDTSTQESEDTQTPAPTETPKDAASDFSTVLMELHALNTYEEREAYVAKLSKTAYEVNEADNAEVVTKSNGIPTDYIYTFDLETEKYIETDAPDSEMYYPTFDQDTLAICCEISLYSDEITEMPTGEFKLMTLTNLATGEVDPWGVKIDIAGVKEAVIEETWGSYTEIVIDPDSPVTVKYTTFENLVNAYNRYSYHEIFGKAIYYSPLNPWEEYDDDWNPTGEYYFYEDIVETIYVEADDIVSEEAWDGIQDYYYDEEYGEYYRAYQDENGNYYYKLYDSNKVTVKDRGYTVVEGEYDLYMLDQEGNLITEIYEETSYQYAPMLMDWDTLKYYDSLYNAQLWQDFLDKYGNEEYSIVDMKAEDYPYVSADKFDGLIKHYMDAEGIILDEEVLAIRASMPENWLDDYSFFYDKAGTFSMVKEDASRVTVTIDKQENWFFRNGKYTEYDVKYGYGEDDEYSELWITDDTYSTEAARYEVTYSFIDIKTDLSDSDVKKAMKERWENHFWEMPEIKTATVNGISFYYLEEVEEWMGYREFYVLQNIGMEKYALINFFAYDMETETQELIGKFLLDGNYSIEQ